MILCFATNKNSKGERDYLIFDTENKIYAYHPEDLFFDDYILISRNEIRNLMIKLDKENYKTVWSL